MRILVTGGATREPIDGIRFVTNISTGRTSQLLCEYFSAQGHQVVAMMGAGLPKIRGTGVSTITFMSFADLNEKLQKALKDQAYDLIIHAAAVGDYSVSQIEADGKTYKAGQLGKIDSRSPLKVTFEPNFKIIGRLKSYAAPAKPVLVGFKLTNSPSAQERMAAVLALSSHADFVIHNDLSEIKDDENHLFTVYRKGDSIGQCRSKGALGPLIERILKEYL